MAHGQRARRSRSSATASTETILNFENRDQGSEWSLVWSTGHVPGMDNATGGYGSRRRTVGRRRMRCGALALGSLLTMHLRVSASALTGGYYIHMLCLIPAMALLANPMRHFEVYLGQWSISGPGRAFRIIPMFDGIGLAIAISSIIRAIVNCAIAALATIYLIHAISDEDLPYTTCRDFHLKTYPPELKPVNEPTVLLRSPQSIDKRNVPMCMRQRRDMNIKQLPFGQNLPESEYPEQRAQSFSNDIKICKNPYDGENYPPYCGTAEYNFFYVEIANYRPGLVFEGFNKKMAIVMTIIWAVIWLCMIKERISHGHLIWNNIPPWLIVVPFVWSAVVIVSGVLGLIAINPDILKTNFALNYGSIASIFVDALETSIYVHAASMGSEIIHGKGLNHYANGHLDPDLNSENMCHSTLLTILMFFSTGGSALCAINDMPQINIIVNDTYGSTTWILPMYSRCMTYGTYTHMKSSLLFSGLIFSYVAVSYVLLKSALHIIFEYKVKLVFIEQFIVGALIITCTLSSMIFATTGGLPLLESIDTMMAGVTMPFVCIMELVVILCIYSGSDFVSDVNISMEESACSTRMEKQWPILPIVLMFVLGYRVWSITGECALPPQFLWYALVPLAMVIVALPMRSCYKASVFFKLSRRH